MKIINLQSKTSVIIWSLVLGTVLAFLVFFLNQLALSFNECKSSTCTAMFDSNLVMKSWPFSDSSEFSGFPYQPYPVYEKSIPATFKSVYTWENLIFWIVIIFLILASIRSAKQKQTKDVPLP